jgi:hypothetical protein
MCIESSVGRLGINKVDDVKTVQILLNMNLRRLGPMRPVPETGALDATTLQAIDTFIARGLPSPLASAIEPSARRPLLGAVRIRASLTGWGSR